MGGLDDIRLDHQVLVDELGRVGVVRVDSAHLRGGKINLVGFFRSEERTHSRLIRQVELAVATRDHIPAPAAFEMAEDRRHAGKRSHRRVDGVDDPQYANARHRPQALCHLPHPIATANCNACGTGRCEQRQMK